jgi:hypothetical protein
LGPTLSKLLNEFEEIIAQANIERGMRFREQAEREHPEVMAVLKSFLTQPAHEVAKTLRGYGIGVDEKGEAYIAQLQKRLHEKRFKR